MIIIKPYKVATSNQFSRETWDNGIILPCNVLNVERKV